MRRSYSFVSLALMLVVLAGCGAPAGPTAAAVASASEIPSTSSAPTILEPPSASPAAAATPSALPTATTGPVSTPAPTTAPKPTLNWDANGCSGSVRDPVALGAKAKVTLKCPVGPTCTLKITYPSGASAKLPSPTHPTPGWWVWTWTVPTGAKGGEATGTSTCTYAGNPHTGPVSFTITAPPPNWSIQVDVPASYSHTSPIENGIMIAVTINGTLPENPAYPHQRVACSFDLNTEGAARGDGFDLYWDNGDGPITWEYQVALIENDVGTGTWSMRCRNLYISPTDWKYDSGTIEIT